VTLKEAFHINSVNGASSAKLFTFDAPGKTITADDLLVSGNGNAFMFLAGTTLELPEGKSYKYDGSTGIGQSGSGGPYLGFSALVNLQGNGLYAPPGGWQPGIDRGHFEYTAIGGPVFFKATADGVEITGHLEAAGPRPEIYVKSKGESGGNPVGTLSAGSKVTLKAGAQLDLAGTEVTYLSLRGHNDLGGSSELIVEAGATLTANSKAQILSSAGSSSAAKLDGQWNSGITVGTTLQFGRNTIYSDGHYSGFNPRVVPAYDTSVGPATSSLAPTGTALRIVGNNVTSLDVIGPSTNPTLTNPVTGW
jgi:hypothetical protein